MARPPVVSPPTPVQETPAPRHLDIACQRALRALAAEPLPRVAAITGGSEFRFAAAVSLVTESLGSSAVGARPFAPAKARWTADEVSALHDRLALQSAADTVVAIAAADRMDRASHDRLLMTLEAPPPRTLVLLSVPDMSQVPKTLAARCDRVVPLTVDTAAVSSVLSTHGLHPHLAQDPAVSALLADMLLADALEPFAVATAAVFADPASAAFAMQRACTDAAAAVSAALAVQVPASRFVALVAAEAQHRLATSAVHAPPTLPSALAALADVHGLLDMQVDGQVAGFVPFIQRLGLRVAQVMS